MTTSAADRLSRKAIALLIIGLFAFTLAEPTVERVIGKPTSIAASRGLCLASVGATAIAAATANPFAVAGGVAAGCQCIPLFLE